uniref:Uncharacterized protein n=1 Tax=Marseillevirus LCMAC101 TaxID=2506602 RepID=A0A481YT87_9VIRU|nr:MAG: hypothetical protein LCMAC101_07160 [Marseillevirus LCMAC101]
MASVIQDNAQNPRVACVSSSKVPPCATFIPLNFKFKGYISTFATAGEAIPTGAVLRPSTTVDKQVVQTIVVNDRAVVGVAAKSATSGESVCMAIGGEFQVLVNGAVTRGDLLASSAVVGEAVSVGVIPASNFGVFAVATNSNANTAVKLVCARFTKAEVGD